MRTKYTKVFAVLALVACAAQIEGCATYKLANGPLEVSYVLANDYHQAQLTAIEILKDPNVPPMAKGAIKKADAAGNPAIHAVADTAKQYAAIKAQIDAIKAAGGDPTTEKILEAQAALAALKAAILNAQPLIHELLTAIRGIR